MTLGRFDVAMPMMTMLQFRAAPCQGHLERLKRIYSYLRRTKERAIQYRTGEPDHNHVDHTEYDWMHPIYGDVKEILPRDER